MANVTVEDLKASALWLSGEPQDGSSDYDAKSVDYLNVIYQTLVNGGTLGTRDVATAAGLYSHLVEIATTDWLWLRKFPPYAFVTTPAILGSAATVNQSTPPPVIIGTVKVTNGSPTITFSIAPAVSVQGWRLFLVTQAAGIANAPLTVPRILQHTAHSVTATLDTGWPQETQTVANFVLFQAEYPLPTDFARFCESPSVQGGPGGPMPLRLSIGSSEQVFDRYPMQSMSQGAPSEAARVNDDIIQMNAWDTQSYRIEFSYIQMPAVLATGATPAQEPLVPIRFRHLLAIGAAMLICLDKVDSRTGSLSSEFREIVAHMGYEYRKEQNAGSELAGRMLYRARSGRRGLLRSSSGIPIF